MSEIETRLCSECGRPAGPFGSCGFPDFCDCDQRERPTFPPNCGDTAPHGPHEHLVGVRRVQCWGVRAPARPAG